MSCGTDKAQGHAVPDGVVELADWDDVHITPEYTALGTMWAPADAAAGGTSESPVRFGKGVAAADAAAGGTATTVGLDLKLEWRVVG